MCVNERSSRLRRFQFACKIECVPSMSFISHSMSYDLSTIICQRWLVLDDLQLMMREEVSSCDIRDQVEEGCCATAQHLINEKANVTAKIKYQEKLGS